MKTNLLPHRFTTPRSNLPPRTAGLKRRESHSTSSHGGGWLLAALLLFAVSSLPALASDPVGIYALVDRVVIEPSDPKAERIQVWGAFALAKGRGDQYAPPQKGYMYFQLKPGEEEVCRREWNDLKSVAGTGQIVAFSARYSEIGTVRDAKQGPEKPDKYVIGFGLTKVGDRFRPQNYEPLKKLREMAEAADRAKPTKKSKTGLEKRQSQPETPTARRVESD